MVCCCCCCCCSAQLAEQANSVPSINSLDFVMESLALGHTIMSHRWVAQPKHKYKDCQAALSDHLFQTAKVSYGCLWLLRTASLVGQWNLHGSDSYVRVRARHHTYFAPPANGALPFVPSSIKMQGGSRGHGCCRGPDLSGGSECRRAQHAVLLLRHTQVHCSSFLPTV